MLAKRSAPTVRRSTAVGKFKRDDLPMSAIEGQAARKIPRIAGTTHAAADEAHPLRRAIDLMRADVRRSEGTFATTTGTP
jgi:hypothetical protein